MMLYGTTSIEPVMTYPQNRMYMVDPVTGAVASAVANHSVAKIKEYIESSDDPETVWEE